MSDAPRLRELVMTAEIHAEGRRCALRYFELRTARGGRRYSCDVLIEGAADRIIIDDDSLVSLEARVARLVPALVLSRAADGHRPGPLTNTDLDGQVLAPRTTESASGAPPLVGGASGRYEGRSG
jgi:hypothetical protein